MKLFNILTIALLFRTSYTTTTTSYKRCFSVKKFDFVMKRDNCDSKLNLFYKPKTSNQKAYVNALSSKNDSITVVVGPAGTGKTLLACNSAINYFKEGAIDKIIIGQRVEIDGQSLTRANLADVERALQFWDTKVKELSSAASGRRRVRTVAPGG